MAGLPVSSRRGHQGARLGDGRLLRIARRLDRCLRRRHRSRIPRRGQAVASGRDRRPGRRGAVQGSRRGVRRALQPAHPSRLRRCTRRAVRGGRRATAAATPAAASRARWTRKRAWVAFIGGVVITVLGVGASYLTWYLRDRDATERARFVPVTAQRVDNGDITFDTSDGRHIVVPEPHMHGEGATAGPTIDVRYDPANPQHVVARREHVRPRHHARDRRPQAADRRPGVRRARCPPSPQVTPRP